jgi:hypothetical protein
MFVIYLCIKFHIYNCSCTFVKYRCLAVAMLCYIPQKYYTEKTCMFVVDLLPHHFSGTETKWYLKGSYLEVRTAAMLLLSIMVD